MRKAASAAFFIPNFCYIYKKNMNKLKLLFVFCIALVLLLTAYRYTTMSSICLVENASSSNPFVLKSHSISGDYLVIDYEIKYAGITKLRIYDKSNTLLWRSQYVDDIIGSHKIVLKYKNMKSGLYKFEISYKKHLETFFVEK